MRNSPPTLYCQLFLKHSQVVRKHGKSNFGVYVFLWVNVLLRWLDRFIFLKMQSDILGGWRLFIETTLYLNRSSYLNMIILDFGYIIFKLRYGVKDWRKRTRCKLLLETTKLMAITCVWNFRVCRILEHKKLVSFFKWKVTYFMEFSFLLVIQFSLI